MKIRNLTLAATLIAGLAGSSAPGVDAASTRFQSNSQNAFAQAAKENKLILIDFYTDWCGWCKKLDREVYTNTLVVDAIRKGFIPLKINPEKDKRGRELATKFGVDGFPNIVILDSQGRKVHQIAGYAPPWQFLQELKAAQARVKKMSKATVQFR